MGIKMNLEESQKSENSVFLGGAAWGRELTGVVLRCAE